MTTQLAPQGTFSGNVRYEVVDGFFKRPRKWGFVEVADVDVDEDDNVYVFNRSAHPVMVFDRNGNFLHTWGEIGDNALSFQYPHGISIGPDGNVYTADTDNHTVKKWTKDGRLLMTIGRANSHAPEQSGLPFNRPTHFTIASNGDYYVSDGYGNSHVHCFDSSGKLKFSWGGRGSEPGQFDTIHSVFIDRDDGDKVYCADRYNNRVQFFTPSGEFVGQWQGLLMPNSVRQRGGLFYVSELGHRISVLKPDGTVVARWGDDAKAEDLETGGGLPTAPARNPMLRGKVVHEPGPGLFSAPHGMTVDSDGSIYVADVAESWTGLDRGSRSVQKFVRV